MFDFSNPDLANNNARARLAELQADAASERLVRSIRAAQPVDHYRQHVRRGLQVAVPALAIIALHILLNS
jgi:hypothetical protein